MAPVGGGYVWVATGRWFIDTAYFCLWQIGIAGRYTLPMSMAVYVANGGYPIDWFCEIRSGNWSIRTYVSYAIRGYR